MYFTKKAVITDRICGYGECSVSPLSPRVRIISCAGEVQLLLKMAMSLQSLYPGGRNTTPKLPNPNHLPLNLIQRKDFQSQNQFSQKRAFSCRAAIAGSAKETKGESENADLNKPVKNDLSRLEKVCCNLNLLNICN